MVSLTDCFLPDRLHHVQARAVPGRGSIGGHTLDQTRSQGIAMRVVRESGLIDRMDLFCDWRLTLIGRDLKSDSSSRLPLHSLPTNFTLDYPDALTAAQLALSWIAHPDYVSHKHDAAIKHAWHKLRRPLMIKGTIGTVPIGPGENNDWPNFGAISIKGSLTDLEAMPSEKLAVGSDTCSFVWAKEGSSAVRVS